MAGSGVRVDNFAAAVAALKSVLPFLVLFYVIDYFLYTQNSSEAGLVFNIIVSTLFIFGFFVIDFFRVRGRMKAALNAPPQQVIVVQQPVYMQAPPGYAYPPPYPQQGQQGAPPQLPLQAGYGYAPYPGPPPPSPPPPPPAPPRDPRKRPPEGSA